MRAWPFQIWSIHFLRALERWHGEVALNPSLFILLWLQIALPSNFACHGVFNARFPNRTLGTINSHMNDLGSSSVNGNEGIKAHTAQQIVIKQAGWMGGSSTSITLYGYNSNFTRCSVRVYFRWLYFEEYFVHDTVTIAVVKMSHNDCKMRLKFQCSNIGHVPFDDLSISLQLLESKHLFFIRRWVTEFPPSLIKQIDLIGCMCVETAEPEPLSQERRPPSDHEQWAHGIDWYRMLWWPLAQIIYLRDYWTQGGMNLLVPRVRTDALLIWLHCECLCWN